MGPLASQSLFIWSHRHEATIIAFAGPWRRDRRQPADGALLDASDRRRCLPGKISAFRQGLETQSQSERALFCQSGRQTLLLSRRHLLALVSTAQSRGGG